MRILLLTLGLSSFVSGISAGDSVSCLGEISCGADSFLGLTGIFTGLGFAFESSSTMLYFPDVSPITVIGGKIFDSSKVCDTLPSVISWSSMARNF